MKDSYFDTIDGQGLIIAFAVAGPENRPDNPGQTDSEGAPIPEGDRGDVSRESDLQENIAPENPRTDPGNPDRPEVDEPGDNEPVEAPQPPPHEVPDPDIDEIEEPEPTEVPDTRPRRDNRDRDPTTEPTTDPKQAGGDTQIF